MFWGLARKVCCARCVPQLFFVHRGITHGSFGGHLESHDRGAVSEYFDASSSFSSPDRGPASAFKQSKLMGAFTYSQPRRAMRAVAQRRVLSSTDFGDLACIIIPALVFVQGR